jgi:membrane protein
MAREQLRALITASREGLALQTLLSILLALWSAQQGVRSFLHALNIVYDDSHRRKLLARFGVGFAFTIGGILFAAAAVATFTIAPFITAHLAIGQSVALFLLRWPAMAAVVVAFALALYRWGPNRTPPPFGQLLPSAILASGAWLAASALFSFWVQTFGNYGQAYGSIAGTVVLLLWLFVSAYIFLLGGELNAEMERQGRVKAKPGRRRRAAAPPPQA